MKIGYHSQQSKRSGTLKKGEGGRLKSLHQQTSKQTFAINLFQKKMPFTSETSTTEKDVEYRSETLIVLGDGGHRGTVNKDGCQEFISCGTYPPCLNTGQTHLIP